MVLPAIRSPTGKPAGYCYELVPHKDYRNIKEMRRIPLLSLAIVAKGSIDLGVENKGKGWFPMYWAGASNEGPNSQNQQPYNPKTVPVHPDATAASVQIAGWRTASLDVVAGVFKFYNSAGTKLSDTTLYYVRPLRTFFPNSQSVPQFRFLRFMSFLSKNGNQDALWDRNDGCEMIGAQFVNAQMYNRVARAWQPWDWSRIEYAWSSQGANILSLDISSNTVSKRNKDVFSCKTSYWFTS
ncbi:hypothetical protein C2E21_3416 [Chlorella sorokiniana]|uniref:Uncharacterized protein n=1 Tax=Chlorella sorokiniana TaxID=3076 RepID=A0A2P6TUF6_CHLSO|nr:hypothetical protein C2E21_3416 [Chlorella sorokiniana]|eukprot:PRW57691.1 hypothetical protein C2E21_3416 [Chlorella sorokiniana]